MATEKRPFSMRFKDESIYKKIRFIADINKRSVAMQIEFILEMYLKDYEKINGEIKHESLKNL